MSHNETVGRLYLEYGDFVLRMARSLTMNAEESADLAQRVWVKAIAEKRLGNSDFFVGPWLARVTRNLAYNTTRDESRRRKILSQARAVENLAPNREREPDEILLEKELAEQVAKALEPLVPAHREVLMLCYAQDIDMKDAAQQIGIPFGTVQSRLGRGKVAARAALEAVESRAVWLESLDRTPLASPCRKLERFGEFTSENR